MSNSQISLINKLSWSLLLDFEIKPSTFQTQNDNLEAMNPFVFGIIKNRTKILPKHLYYYMLKSTCAVNLLCKLSIIFKEWRVMNNVAGAELLFSLYFRYYTQSFFFVTRLIINQINQVQWVDFKLENVLVSLHSLTLLCSLLPSFARHWWKCLLLRGLGSIISKEWRVTWTFSYTYVPVCFTVYR